MSENKNVTLVQTVNQEIGKGSALEYLKTLGKGVLSNKLRAMVASAVYVGVEKTKKKLESVTAALAAFDIKSERQAVNYVNAGLVMMKANMTEHQAVKIGLSRIMTYASKILNEEQAGDVKSVEVAIKEYEATTEQKRAERDEKTKAEAAARKQATLADNELLQEEFDPEEGLTATRVWAHVTVWAASIDMDKDLEMVAGTNAVTGLKKLFSLVHETAEAMRKAEAEKAAQKATGTEGKAPKAKK